jgi:hypothetical protein
MLNKMLTPKSKPNVIKRLQIISNYRKQMELYLKVKHYL